MTDKFQSGRWDIDYLINNSGDLNALWLLWRGRANDIEDYATNRGITPEEKAAMICYRKCADELEKALQICIKD